VENHSSEPTPISIGGDPLEFYRDLWNQKTKSPRAIVWHCLRDPVFSHLSRSPTYDRWTDAHWQHIPH